MVIKSDQTYNQFLQSLESKTKEGFFFHDIEDCIYITSDEHRLLGIWDKKAGKPHNAWKTALPPSSSLGV